jgi:hypothetical protein
MAGPDPIPWSGTTLTPPAVQWVDAGGELPAIPAPPLDDQTWVDMAATYEAVLLALRVTTNDPDADAILFAIQAAASLIDQYLDRTDPLPVPPPAPVQTALEQLSVELYRRKDAPFNLLNATVPEDIPVDITGVGAIQSVAPLIQPWRQRWGFA